MKGQRLYSSRISFHFHNLIAIMQSNLQSVHWFFRFWPLRECNGPLPPSLVDPVNMHGILSTIRWVWFCLWLCSCWVFSKWTSEDTHTMHFLHNGLYVYNTTGTICSSVYGALSSMSILFTKLRFSCCSAGAWVSALIRTLWYIAYTHIHIIIVQN
jgi:hypothetical protein